MLSIKYLTIFDKTLGEIIDRHAPLTKVTRNERTLQSKWINKEIKHRNEI